MIWISFLCFILMGLFYYIGIYSIGNIVKQNNLIAKRKKLFIDVNDLKKQLYEIGKPTDNKKLNKAIFYINISKILILITFILFAFQIKY